MLSKVLSAVAGIALVNAQAQGPAPLPSTLSTTFSGVLPVLPSATPFNGLETLEGAITNNGPANPGFTGVLGNASVQEGNPAATYRAILPTFNFNNATGSIVTGTITGTAAANGTGVLFTVNLTGLPDFAAYGPFGYHIHTLPVPADGNCTATLSHLDPTNRGEYYDCDRTAPQTCQAGDLAGKHGNITAATFQANYTEFYLSTTAGSPYFFGDKSIVIHARNTTRLTCANFALINATTGTPTESGATTTGTSTTDANNPGFTANSASRMSVGVLGAAAGLSALLFSQI